MEKFYRILTFILNLLPLGVCRQPFKMVWGTCFTDEIQWQQTKLYVEMICQNNFN